MKKQTTIEIETETILVLHLRSAGQVWCPDCASEVSYIHPEDLPEDVSRKLSPTQPPEAAAALHWIKAPDGSVRLCLNSLLAWLQAHTRGFLPPRAPRKEGK